MRKILTAAAVVIASFSVAACEKVPFLAPTGSTITLTTANTVLSANGTATIVAQVLESAGTPPHSGTRITFTTTLGTVEPSEVSTDASGRATVTFRANGANGIAIIAANSGGATTSTGGSTGTGTGGSGGTSSSDRNLRIAVGTAAVSRVIILANPSVLPTAGGATTIIANVIDINGNPLSGAPVTFTTTAGSISTPTATTDASGNATITLTTFQNSTVTATVGAASSSGGGTGTGTGGTGGTTTGSSSNQASVTVTLTSQPGLSITPPTTPPSAGLPGLFTFKVTPATSTGTGSGGTGSTGAGGTVPIRELVVNWGDGTPSDNFGAVSGDQIASHIWRGPGTYTVTATVTDVAGGTARVAAPVTIIQSPRPTVIVTPTPQSAPGGSTISFRIEVTAPAGLAINNVVIDFGDGTSQTLGGASGVLTVAHPYAAGVRTYTVTVTVTDSTGVSTIGTAIVSITT